MGTSQQIDPTETPLDPDEPQERPPLSGTVDDADDADDERWDENEPPDKQLKDRSETLDEFPREEDPSDEPAGEND
jgi:hypothetical protein